MTAIAKTVDTKIINSLQILNTSEKKVLLAVAETLVKEHKEDAESLLTKAQKAELDLTLTAHKSGKLKYYTIEQAKKIIYGNQNK